MAPDDLDHIENLGFFADRQVTDREFERCQIRTDRRIGCIGTIELHRPGHEAYFRRWLVNYHDVRSHPRGRRIFNGQFITNEVARRSNGSKCLFLQKERQ